MAAGFDEPGENLDTPTLRARLSIVAGAGNEPRRPFSGGKIQRLPPEKPLHLRRIIRRHVQAEILHPKLKTG